MNGGEPVPPGVDPAVPSPARVYDYVLGGTHNYQAGREAAERIRAVIPEMMDGAWANRGFHQRAARWIAQRGVRQIILIGPGPRRLSRPRDAVELLQAGEQDAPPATGGLRGEIVGEPPRTEHCEYRGARIMATRGQYLSYVLQPAEFRHPRPAVPVLGLTDDHDRDTRRPWPAATGQGEHVDVVRGLVLAARDNGVPYRPDRQAGLVVGVAREPVSRQRFQMRPEDLRVDRVLNLAPHLRGTARFQVSQVRLDDELVQTHELIGDGDHGTPVTKEIVAPLDEPGRSEHPELVRERGGRPGEQSADLGRRAFSRGHHREHRTVGRDIADSRILVDHAARFAEQRHAGPEHVADQPGADAMSILRYVRVRDQIPVSRCPPDHRVMDEGGRRVLDSPVAARIPVPERADPQLQGTAAAQRLCAGQEARHDGDGGTAQDEAQRCAPARPARTEPVVETLDDGGQARRLLHEVGKLVQDERG